jgi:hypothetical protein
MWDVSADDFGQSAEFSILGNDFLLALSITSRFPALTRMAHLVSMGLDDLWKTNAVSCLSYLSQLQNRLPREFEVISTSNGTLPLVY